MREDGSSVEQATGADAAGQPDALPADAQRARGDVVPSGSPIPGDPDALPVFPARPGRLRTTPLRGMAMGLADSVPGVSGGTVALILGIHPRLVRAIAAIDISIAAALLAGREKARRAWQHADLGFLGLLAFGIVAGLLAGAKALSIILERWPAALMALLLGLVVASIHHPAKVPRWDMRDVLLACTAGLGAFIIGVVPGLVAPTALWFLPVAGAIASCAMILPGISGAYLLVLMGLYEPIIHAVADLVDGALGRGPLLGPLLVVAAVGIGAVVGLLAFSRGLRHLLDRHPGPTHAAMVGLLVGSLVRLWPWRDAAGFAQGMPIVPDAAMPVAFLALGVLIGLALDFVGRRTA